MILHGYWRSGTSYRTRIALNLKGVEYRQAALDLRTGAQKSEPISGSIRRGWSRRWRPTTAWC